MIDHNKLMEEMEYIDKLPRNERVMLAYKRRKDQLATYGKWMKTEEYIASTKPRPKNRKGIKFTQDIELLDTASRNALDEMRSLLKAGADPNQKNYDGLTALHQCCIDGSLDMVTLLVKNGANVNVRDRDLWTPLHAAATCGHFKIVTLLIKAGADLTAINGDGDMPHDIAEDEVMQQYLENEMAKREITEEALDDIRQATHTKMLADIKYILSTGGDLNRPLDQRGTFLHTAIANGFNDIVRLLLKNGASVTARDEDGWEPIHVAAYWNNERAIDLLVQEKDIDLRTTTDNGETPHDLCEDTELKLTITNAISDMSQKYGSVRNFVPDPDIFNKKTKDIRSDNEFRSNSDDGYEDTVTDTLTFNLSRQHSTSEDTEEDEVNEDSRKNNEEEDELKDMSTPLLNFEASEQSERRNSVKEAKHLAPIKRANSIDRHYQPTAFSIPHTENKDIMTMEDDEHIPTTDMSNTYMNVHKNAQVKQNLSNDRTNNNISESNRSPIYENASPSLEQKRQHSRPTTETVINDNGTSSNHNHVTQPKVPRRQYSEEREQNNERAIKKIAPNKLTLIDLKKARQEARQFQRQCSREVNTTQTTMYTVTGIYEAPPSPTMIRYSFKSTSEDIVQHSIIKEKKCVIM